jgi:hypothetical protein
MNTLFLSQATQAHYTLFNAAISAGKTSGLCVQPTLVVESSVVEIGAHSGLFGCGVYFEESATTSLTISDLSSAVATKTLAWELDEGLYASPSLVELDGLLAPGYDDYHVVVAWIIYPGSNLTLTSAMLVGAPIAQPSRILQFFDAAVVYDKLTTAVNSASGITTSFSNGWSSIVSSTASVTNTFQIEFPLHADSAAISCLNLDIVLSSQAYVKTYLKRYGSAISQVTDGTVSGTLSACTWQIPLVREDMQTWKRFSIYLDLVLSPGASASIGSFAASNENVLIAAART